MTERTTVLACIDGSSFTGAVIDYSAWVAYTVNAPLRLLNNIERGRMPSSDLSGSIGLGAREELLDELVELESRRSKILMEQGRIMLTHATERACDFGGAVIESLQQHGDLTDSLIDMEHEIRVLVVGIRGEGHEDREKGIGAQLETIIRALHRPILVVNRPFDSAPQRMMLAYDGSEASRKALNMIISSPLYQEMECHVVHVNNNAEEAQALLAQASSELQAAGLQATTETLTGDVVPALLEYQHDHQIELTVMGAFGHNRLRELLFGSLTAKMLVQSKVPLLLLR